MGWRNRIVRKRFVKPEQMGGWPGPGFPASRAIESFDRPICIGTETVPGEKLTAVGVWPRRVEHFAAIESRFLRQLLGWRISRLD